MPRLALPIVDHGPYQIMHGGRRVRMLISTLPSDAKQRFRASLRDPCFARDRLEIDHGVPGVVVRRHRSRKSAVQIMAMRMRIAGFEMKERPQFKAGVGNSQLDIVCARKRYGLVVMRVLVSIEDCPHDKAMFISIGAAPIFIHECCAFLNRKPDNSKWYARFIQDAQLHGAGAVVFDAVTQVGGFSYLTFAGNDEFHLRVAGCRCPLN